jgi:hypothetical protein
MSIPTLVDSDSILHHNRIRAILIIISILIVGITLYIGAYFDNQRIRIPTICGLLQEKNLGSSVTCEQLRKKDLYRRVKLAGKNIQRILKNEIQNGLLERVPSEDIDGIPAYKIKKEDLEDILVQHNLDKKDAHKMLTE